MAGIPFFYPSLPGLSFEFAVLNNLPVFFFVPSFFSFLLATFVMAYRQPENAFRARSGY